MLLLRIIATFLACEMLLVMRLAPGRWFYASLVVCLALKYLALQYIPVYGGTALLFHAAMLMVAVQAVLYLFVRASPFGRKMALEGQRRPWHTGRLLLQLLVFRPRTTLLRVEPIVAAAYGAFCYLTPIVRPVWLPFFLPLHPPGFVYDEAMYRAMLLIGQSLPVLTFLGVMMFGRFEWRQSHEAFEEEVRQPPRETVAPPAEFSFPPLAQKTTRGVAATPSLAELTRSFGQR